MEPGAKDVRNPRIVFAFRHIGLGENAGWGLQEVFRNWQRLGHVPPRIGNDKRHKSFELVLASEELMSEAQRAFQQGLGASLTAEQARTFALACREDEITLSQIELVAGVSGAAATTLAEQMIAQSLFRPAGPRRYALSRHLRDQASSLGDGDSVTPAHGQPSERGLVTDQPPALQGGLVTPAVLNLTEHQKNIILICDVPRTRAELMERTGLNHRAYFGRKHLDPLVRAGLIRMTRPDKPHHPHQAYVVTEAGLAFLRSATK